MKEKRDERMDMIGSCQDENEMTGEVDEGMEGLREEHDSQEQGEYMMIDGGERNERRDMNG